MPQPPAYLALHASGELACRVERALASLQSCRVCPRDCDVDRLADRYAFCKTGRHAVVSSAFPHFGEEDCLYDSAESLALLDGVVDVYMPDFKYWSPDKAARYLKAEDYPDVARARIVEMHRQVGPLRIGDQGLAYRGLLIRHLVMPDALDETAAILGWIRETLGPDTYVNLMDQYYPAGRVGPEHYPEIDRRLRVEEFREAEHLAARLGLTRLDERRPHPLLARRMVG
jgi:uncharacterized Fe-S radical SAM superfamily protein PflX